MPTSSGIVAHGDTETPLRNRLHDHQEFIRKHYIEERRKLKDVLVLLKNNCGVQISKRSFYHHVKKLKLRRSDFAKLPLANPNRTQVKQRAFDYAGTSCDGLRLVQDLDQGVQFNTTDVGLFGFGQTNMGFTTWPTPILHAPYHGKPCDSNFMNNPQHDAQLYCVETRGKLNLNAFSTVSSHQQQPDFGPESCGMLPPNYILDTEMPRLANYYRAYRAEASTSEGDISRG
ncbi:hypothetical protein TWF102_008087 [Orbilia oligospora]|uniref:Clr5 domain-containing protein n=1 Tax=Orbilia oligospora TaxID=2813651 RepID=A0A7C8NG37_ORBOL|nr:hypothetical protein TWF706_009823 [Orbilia oligospora]KAF3091838.1 hypothetical protein TWF103_011400 [Orbilia oligospora]KAF3110510.1 hypothetical protein TWF102_008087 [Orbilia oligospora]